MRILSFSSLPVPLQEETKRVVSLFWERAALANVMLREDQQIRPMVIHRGRLLLLRSVRVPSASPLSSQLKRLSELASSPFGEFRACGDGQWLLARHFVSETYSERSGEDGALQLENCKPLLEQFRLLHAAGIPHGHFTASNVGIESSKCRLLDPLLSLERERGLLDIAELRLRDARSLAAWLLTHVEALTPSQRGTLELASSSGDMNQVDAAFGVGGKQSPPQIIRSAGEGKSQFQGKILSPKQETEQTLPGIITPKPRPSPPQSVSPSEPAPNEKASPLTSPAAGFVPEQDRSSAEVDDSGDGDSLQKFGFILLGAFAACLGLMALVSKSPTAFSKKEPFAVESSWGSESVEELRKVVGFAIDHPNSRSRELLLGVEDKAPWNKHILVPMIHFGLSGAHAVGIPERERKFLLAIASQRLDPQVEVPALDVQSFRPMTLLTLLGFYPSEKPPKFAAQLALGRFINLPNPLGDFFSILHQRMKLRTFAEPAAYTAAQIAVGNYRPGAFDKFITSISQTELREVFYSLIAVASESYSELRVKSLVNDIGFSETEFAQRILWFDQPSLAGLDELSAREKLAISSGAAEFDELEIDQLTELIGYPSPIVQASVIEVLVQRFDQLPVGTFFEAVAPSLIRMDKKQRAFFLVSILASESEQGPLFDKWFSDFSPAPAIVVELLAGIRVPGVLEPLSFNAVRYLSSTIRDPKSRWQAVYAEKKSLLGHPDEFVRSFAYSLLDPTQANERLLLEQMQVVETSEKLRTMIGEVLSTLDEDLNL